MGMNLPAESKNQIMAEQKKIIKLLKQKRRKEALTYLINLCQENILPELFEKMLMEEFYLPYKESLKKCYERNRLYLEKYPYFKPELSKGISEFDFIILKCDEEYFKYNLQDKQLENILPHPRDSIDTRTGAGKVIIFKNYFNFKKVFIVEIENREENPSFPWMKKPLYLYYDSIVLLLPYLQCFDFSLILKNERIVFLFTREELSAWFQNYQTLLPKIYLSLEETDELIDEINRIHQRNDENYKRNRKEADEYYGHLSSKDLLDSLQSGKPRILFFTSIFSTATQYYIRDLARACDRLHIPNRILIEEGNIFRVTTADLFECLNEFRPDIFFMINDFRYQRDILPANMLYFMWAMDPYERMSYESAAKTTELDFILDYWFSKKELLLERGHPEDRIIEGPIIVPDAKLYREYDLSDEEQKEYSCDICLFSNAGNPRKGLDSFLIEIKGHALYTKFEKLYTDAYEELYQNFYNESLIYSIEEYKEFLDRYYEEYGVGLPEKDKEQMAFRFIVMVGWQILRSLPLEWLHEKGYNMRLWGRAWLDHPVLNKYAQGVAENGEKLAKVIKASKIVLGTNPGASAHPRVFETFLSGGFYMGINIPVEHDLTDVRTYMEENKEIVFYYDKEDLYRKVDYYLENEETRKEIIKNAQKKIRSEINYENLFPKVLAEVAQKLARQINI